MKNDERELPRLVVMLTYNDYTVEHAAEVFEQCADSKARYWGFKERPLPKDDMKALYERIKQGGKTTVLEVVGYDETTAMDGVMMAKECGVDILMGTKFYESVAHECETAGIKYMPFVGQIEGRPSVLTGTVEAIIEEAKYALAHGAWGIDLLGYRYTGDACELNRRLVTEIDAPVCIAGSIDSFRRLDEVKEVAPWGFTIGSAFFDKKFADESICSQIDRVVEYLEK